MSSLIPYTVAEIVSDNYKTAEVFKRHGIDFCCGGKKTISAVCVEKQIDETALQRELEIASQLPGDVQHDYKKWSLSFMTDYIVNVHHTYINNNLALIDGFANKVAKVHGHHNTETVTIAKLWKQISDELTIHMKKEELVLFPYIRSVEKYMNKEISEMPVPHFRIIDNPIHVMEAEHDLAGSIMHQIHDLSNNFTPPEYACNTYRVLYSKLQEF